MPHRLLRALLLLAIGLPVLAQDAPFSGEISLFLKNGLMQKKETRDLPQDVAIDLSATEGVWGHAWAYGDAFNRADHRGRVTQAAIGPNRVHLEVALKVEGDPWVPGGRATYTLDLTRTADGRLAGTYTGVFRRRDNTFELKDTVTGRLFPAGPSPAAVPAKPDEHPRLLFRKADLPRLRATVKNTAFGREVYQKLQAATARPDSRNDGEMQEKVLALGMLYQLDGDVKYAEQAKGVITVLRSIGYHNGANGLPEPWGWNAATIGLAFDLCCDGWDAAYRNELAEHLEYYAERLILRPNNICQKMNWDPGSNYQPGTRGGGAIAALAVWGEQGPAPEPPTNPGAEPRTIAPAAGFTPQAGVPVSDWAEGPQYWLMVGPFAGEATDDALAAIGGRERACLAPGEAVTYQGETSTVRALDPALGNAILRIDQILKGLRGSTSFYYTVLRNDQQRLVKIGLGHGNARLWLGGQPVLEGHYVRLAPGLYPVLVQVRIGNPYGAVTPQFAAVSEEVAKDDTARLYAEYTAAMRDYQEDQAAWTATGADPRMERMAALARRVLARYYQYMMGDGGWQAEGEGYTLWSTPLALEAAHAYRTMYGRNVTPRPDVSHFGPRYVMQNVFGDKVTSQSFGAGGTGVMGLHHYARLFAVTDEAYKPAVLWAWNRMAGLGDTAGKAFTPAATLATGDLRDSIYTLVNYPTDMTPRNPGEVLPHAWAATGRGGFIFRNAWEGADDIVAQMYLKAQPPSGWNHPNAGSLRICGLGKAWGIEGTGNPKDGQRFFENVVWLPQDVTKVSNGAVLTHYDSKPDGSGTLTADMTPLYMRPRVAKNSKGEEEEAATGANNVWLTEDMESTGISGWRAFAVDYSGVCGAPALFALADHIQGGGEKVWLWQLPDPDAGATVTVEGNSFAIRQGDATLRGTVITPAAPVVKVEQGVHEIRTVKSSVHMTFEMKKVEMNAISVTGGDDFLVIFTLQRGPAPAVQVQGEGLKAKVTVGKQTIRFDGTGFVLGPQGE